MTTSHEMEDVPPARGVERTKCPRTCWARAVVRQLLVQAVLRQVVSREPVWHRILFARDVCDDDPCDGLGAEGVTSRGQSRRDSHLKARDEHWKSGSPSVCTRHAVPGVPSCDVLTFVCVGLCWVDHGPDLS